MVCRTYKGGVYMEKMFYCVSCQAYHNTKIIEKEETLTVKGRKITLTIPVRVCEMCGEEIIDEELDDASLAMFYEEYRRLENLLQPTEIKAIRQRYNLSQASFAKLLGFGEKTITRYESGAIQDVCHDNLIRLMDSLDSFSLLWKERKDRLSAREQAYIDNKLDTYNKIKIQSMYTVIPQYYASSPTKYNARGGYSNAG